MNNLNIEFDEMVNEKVAKLLDKNQFYKKEAALLDKLQDDIYKNSSNEECQNLDNLLSIMYSMKSKEFYIAYQLGFYEGIIFKEKMENN